MDAGPSGARQATFRALFQAARRSDAQRLVTLVVAAMLLPGHAEPALFVIGGEVLSLLLIGIRNAWDTVTYVVTSESQQLR